MISLLKALIPGTILTCIVSVVIGSGGGFLNIHQVAVAGYDVYWSWPMFLGATGLAWFLIAMTK